MFIIGSSTPRTTIVGTAGDDFIIAPAALTTIDGGGGNDVVDASGSFDTINFGGRGDGAFGESDTALLTGQNDSLVAGDEDVGITGLGTGFDTVTLGRGTNTVDLAGTNNSVALDTGTSDVAFQAGSNAVSAVDFAEASAMQYHDDITFVGTRNSYVEQLGQFFGGGLVLSNGTAEIAGGSGYSTFSIALGATTLTTDGLYNVVNLTGGSGDITPGSGHDSVNIDDFVPSTPFVPGTYTVHLAGSYDTIDAVAQSVTSDGGTGSGTFNFAIDPVAQMAHAQDGVPKQYTVVTGGMYNSFTLLDMDSNTITTGSGGAMVTISSPPSSAGVLTPQMLRHTALTFDGLNNSLSDTGAGGVTATGGTGRGTFVLGSGNDSLTTGGFANTVIAGAGTDTINPGGGTDTVTLNGTNVLGTASGTGDKFTFNSGAQGSLTDNSQGLHVYFAPGVGAVDLVNLASDAHFVIDLMAGVGGYTTAAQAAAAVHSDGSGGSMLALGAGSIDFEGVGSVPATAFHIN